MTREKSILSELNTIESRIKNAILAGDMDKYNHWDTYQRGVLKGLFMLGYRAIEDPQKAQNINGYWVNHYIEIRDFR